MDTSGDWLVTVDVEIPIKAGVHQNVVFNDVAAAMQQRGTVTRVSVRPIEPQ